MTDFSFITSTSSVLVTLAWENSWHFVKRPLDFPRNDVWETRAEIPYWWRVYRLLLRSEQCFTRHDQSEALPKSGRVISMEFLRPFLTSHFAGKQRWRREMSAVFSGYTNPRSLNGTSNSTCPWVIPSTLSMKLLNTAFNLCRNSRSA